MSLAHAIIVKIAVGTTAAAVLGGGAAASVTRQSATPTRQAAAGALSPVPGETGETTFDAVVDPATGTVRLVSRADAAGTSGAGGATAKGGPAGRDGRQLSSGAPATPAAPLAGTRASSNGGAGGGPSGGSASGGGTVQAPSGGSLGAGSGSSGGSGGSGTTPGGAPGSGGNTPVGSVSISPGPAPTAPKTNVPPAPSSLTAHSEGSFTVVVPGSDRVSKQLCLNGTAADKCQIITVPALKPVELTVNFSGNAGTDKPTFAPASCPGGVLVKVTALTPGAILKVTVNGKALSAKVQERGVQQTASLCDAP